MKLRAKITLTYIIIAVMVVLGIGIFTSIWIESYFKNQLIDILDEKTEFIIFYLEKDALLTSEKLDSKIKELSDIFKIRITLTDNDGKVISDSDIPIEKIDSFQNQSDRPEILQAKAKGIGYNTMMSTTIGKELFYYAKRLNRYDSESEFKKTHYVRVALPLEGIKEQVVYFRTIITITGVVVLLFVLVVSLFVSKFMTRPMIQIAEAVRKIRAGNLETKIEINTKDEIESVAVAINELVDELKADIIELKRLEKVRSQFLGNVSHELRTPIFTIQGYLETLQQGAIDDKTVNRAFLEKARTNLERLNALLEDLISISQIESGEMKMSLRFFEVNEFLESIFKEYKEIAVSKKIKLSLSLGTSAEDLIYGDRDRLRQVMYNLISNAISYNKENGEVIISSEKINGEIKIAVKDTGIGISPEHLPRIFERFYRVDSNRSREIGGTGLGLAIVKHIIEAHSAEIKVESSIGEGSIFSFTLKRG